MSRTTAQTVREAQMVIADLPDTEPSSLKNPMRLYGVYSASHAYRFTADVADRTDAFRTGLAVTGKAIDIGEGDSRAYTRSWAARVHRPALIVTRRTDNLCAQRKTWLYEVWYVRPETLYQTKTTRGFGFTNYLDGERLWAIHDGKVQLGAWTYGSVTVYSPHWAYVCQHCGREDFFSVSAAARRYAADPRVCAAQAGACFECNHFLDTCARLPRCRVAIVNGTHYSWGLEGGPRTLRGYGGREFAIRFVDGRTVETSNLWCQGEIPNALREKFPDRFADNAVFVQEEGGGG